jgi:hypothetical protein
MDYGVPDREGRGSRCLEGRAYGIGLPAIKASTEASIRPLL